MTGYLDPHAAKVFGHGSCPQGSPSEGYWNSDGTREGRLICYDTTVDGEDHFRIVWSHDDALVVTVILDTSATEAGEWWKDRSWMLA